jgi:post-segregation antitoxin (ccd killing protein)
MHKYGVTADRAKRRKTSVSNLRRWEKCLRTYEPTGDLAEDLRALAVNGGAAAEIALATETHRDQRLLAIIWLAVHKAELAAIFKGGTAIAAQLGLEPESVACYQRLVILRAKLLRKVLDADDWYRDGLPDG